MQRKKEADKILFLIIKKMKSKKNIERNKYEVTRKI